LRVISEKALEYLSARVGNANFEESLMAVFGQKSHDIPLNAIDRDEDSDWFLVEDARTGIVYTLTRNSDGYFPTPSELMAEIDDIDG